MGKPGILGGLAGIVLLAVAMGALAQQVPGGVLPGQIERQFERPREPRAPIEVVVPAAPESRAPADAERVRFVLGRLVVDGASAYSQEQLRPAWQALEGKEISLADLYRVAETLTRRYRNDGYILSQVAVPAQTIRDGSARLQAVEGYVANTHVTGDAGSARGLIDTYLARIREARPLRNDVLERNLLLINDLAGIGARATLSPSSQAGASDLTLAVTQANRSFGVGLNNRGSKFLGPWRWNADADFYGALGGGDRTGLRLIRTLADNELTLLSASHDRPLGASGAKLGLTGTLVEAHPGVGAVLPNLETSSRSAAATVSYPLTRSRTGNLTVRGGLSYHDGHTDSGPTRLSTDHIRAARFGLAWDSVDAWRGINLVDAEFSQGINAGGASDFSTVASRASVPAGFQKATLYAARLQSIAPKWSILGALNGQYAFTNLLAPEQFAYGGDQFGRAYDAAELLGDSGLALKAELRYNDRGTGLLRDYMLYAFADHGQIRRRTPLVGEARNQSAEAVGAGIRFNIQGGVVGFVEGAVPNRVVNAEGRKRARLFTGVQVNF